MLVAFSLVCKLLINGRYQCSNSECFFHIFLIFSLGEICLWLTLKRKTI